jgi:hypothetical protein
MRLLFRRAKYNDRAPGSVNQTLKVILALQWAGF